MHLDEMVCRVRGKRAYLWSAVDDEGEVLGRLIHRHQDSWTATKFLIQPLMKHAVYPERIVTDKLGSYALAAIHLNSAQNTCATAEAQTTGQIGRAHV